MEKYDVNRPVVLKKGVYQLNDEANFNYQLNREINMLKNVRSLTFRLFTDKEDAQNHCNVGNGKLVVDEILDWILRIK